VPHPHRRRRGCLTAEDQANNLPRLLGNSPRLQRRWGNDKNEYEYIVDQPPRFRQGRHVSKHQGPVLTAEGPEAPAAPLLRYHVNKGLEADDRGQGISCEEYSPFKSSVLLACRSDIEALRPFRFAAYPRDNETSLYACGARYYAPWLGRWTSADPIGTADGHNLYAYVRNDPKLLERADYDAKPFVEKMKHKLNENKEEYATAI
jgi:RHS repeat-associated protein